MLIVLKSPFPNYLKISKKLLQNFQQFGKTAKFGQIYMTNNLVKNTILIWQITIRGEGNIIKYEEINKSIYDFNKIDIWMKNLLKEV